MSPLLTESNERPPVVFFVHCYFISLCVIFFVLSSSIKLNWNAKKSEDLSGPPVVIRVYYTAANWV